MERWRWWAAALSAAVRRPLRQRVVTDERIKIRLGGFQKSKVRFQLEHSWIFHLAIFALLTVNEHSLVFSGHFPPFLTTLRKRDAVFGCNRLLARQRRKWRASG